MGETPRWRRYLRFWRSDVRADVDDELLFHIETRARDLAAAGMPPLAARAEAERQFGELTSIRDACVTIEERRSRRAERGEVMEQMRLDTRFAVRTLARNPAFTAMSMLCIALGVAVTTTIFSWVHSILLRPLPYAHSEELVSVYGRKKARDENRSNISYPDYVSWREGNRTFAALGMWTWNTLTFTGDAEPERLEGAEVTANLFPLLGVRPMLGRFFLASEEQPGSDRVVLLGYGAWRRRFGGDPTIVGRAITVNGLPYTVVGIMPRGFAFPEQGQAWIPLVPDETALLRGNRFLAGALGRLKPGVTPAQAQADLDVISAALQREYREENFGWDAEVVTLREDLVGNLRRPLLVFMGAVGFVLLIACANVANLMLARGAARQREIAVRVAIGAGRGRLVRQILTESLVLAVAGGVLGALLATVLVRLLRLAFPEEVPFYISLGVDATTLLFAVGVTALTGVLVGIVPALRSADLSLGSTLREGSRGGGGDGRSRSRVRSALVVAELALSLVLMIGATLLIESYRALHGTELGFESRGILSMRVSLPEAKYPERPRRAAFYTQLQERVREMPGVEAVGTAQGIPFSGWNVQGSMSIEGRPRRPKGEELVVHFQWVSPEYFKAIGAPVLRGRGLTPADRDSASPVGVINETLARREFAGQDPVGKRIRPDWDEERWVTIVGVVRDFRHYRLPEPMGPAIYYAYDSYPLLTQTLVVRTSLADPLSLVPAVKSAIRTLDSDVPAYRVQTFDQVVSGSLWRQRLQGQVLGAFAALALLLATVGIYGVISYAVAQRTREIGVRMALGATRGNVLGMVVREGTRLAALGVLLGLAGALALTRVLSSLLHEVSATDPLTFASVALALAAAAVIASYVPARRATKVDPLVAMRAD